MKNKIAKILFATVFFLASVSQAGAAFNWGAQVDLGGGNAVYVGEGNTSLNNGGFGALGGMGGGYGLPGGTIFGILQTTLMWLLGIFSVLGILAFVISGVKYLLAGANADLAKDAKQNMTWAIIGIIVGLSGFIVLTAVSAWLSGSKTF